MTNEVAIHNLFVLKLRSKILSDKEAIALAIKALEQQPCEDCISRKDVLAMKRLFVDEDGVMAYAVPTGNILRLRPVTPKYTDEEIDKAQAVEQAYVDKMVELAVEETKRPTARWEKYVDDYIKCSKCGMIAKFYRNYNYCPNCGAKMEEI